MASKESVMRLLEAAARVLAESESVARRHEGEAHRFLNNTRRTRHQRGFY